MSESGQILEMVSRTWDMRLPQISHGYKQRMGVYNCRSLPALARNISRMKTRYLNDQNTCVTQLELCIAVTFVISSVVKIVSSNFSVQILFPGFINITKKYIFKKIQDFGPLDEQKLYDKTKYSLSMDEQMSSSPVCDE